ncbi:MAG: hypothetical protein IPL65_10310 [Lewinellaceae bacterium]|nr:hypothetical protein [Lewinellaceae bacterium]
MNQPFLLTDDLLWDYIDGFLDAPEQLRVEAYLSEHPAWQAKLAAIKAEQQQLMAAPLEKPDTLFADKVLRAWASEQVGEHALQSAPAQRDWIIRAFAIVMGVLLTAPLLLFVMSAVKAKPSNLPPISIPSVDMGPMLDWISLPAVQLGMVSLLALGFLQLLDRYLHAKLLLRQQAG